MHDHAPPVAFFGADTRPHLLWYNNNNKTNNKTITNRK